MHCMRIDLSTGRVYAGRYWRGPCPSCSKGGRDDALLVDMSTGRRRCWRCDERGTVDDFTPVTADPDVVAQRLEEARFAACRLFSRATPICDGDPVATYLHRRGIPTPPDGWPADLRTLASARHPSGHVGPAMVALIRSVDSRPVAVQRTWVTSDGHKADVRPARLSLGPATGGAVRCGSAEDVVICEGVEDALAAGALWPDLCGWATLGCSGMVSLELPPELQWATIAPDQDEPGRRAAQSLARRLKAEGRAVAIREVRGHDPNQMLQLRQERK